MRQPRRFRLRSAGRAGAALAILNGAFLVAATGAAASGPGAGDQRQFSDTALFSIRDHSSDQGQDEGHGQANGHGQEGNGASPPACSDLQVLGGGLPANAGTYTIDLIPPSGDGGQVFPGSPGHTGTAVWRYQPGLGDPQVVATVPLQVVLANASAAARPVQPASENGTTQRAPGGSSGADQQPGSERGPEGAGQRGSEQGHHGEGRPASNPGLHLRLNAGESTVEFWISCALEHAPAPGASPDPGGLRPVPDEPPRPSPSPRPSAGPTQPEPTPAPEQPEPTPGPRQPEPTPAPRPPEPTPPPRQPEPTPVPRQPEPSSGPTQSPPSAAPAPPPRSGQESPPAVPGSIPPAPAPGGGAEPGPLHRAGTTGSDPTLSVAGTEHPVADPAPARGEAIVPGASASPLPANGSSADALPEHAGGGRLLALPAITAPGGLGPQKPTPGGSPTLPGWPALVVLDGIAAAAILQVQWQSRAVLGRG